MTIGMITIDHAAEMARSLMRDYQARIDEAYRKADGALTVNLSLKFSPQENKTFVEAEMSFVAEKVTDRISGSVSEDQMGLFGGEPGSDKDRFRLHTTVLRGGLRSSLSIRRTNP
jgi:hypothetical protein